MRRRTSQCVREERNGVAWRRTGRNVKSAFTWDEENDTSVVLATSQEIFNVLLRRVDTCCEKEKQRIEEVRKQKAQQEREV